MFVPCGRCTRRLVASGCKLRRRCLNTTASTGGRSQRPQWQAYPLLSIPALTFGLGCWQVQRLKWKRGLIEQLNSKLTLEPVELPEDLSVLSSMEYQRVHVTGEFVHSRELLIRPRTLIDHDYTPGGGGGMAGSSAIIGAHVVTPFRLDNGMEILVNRGWVPRDRELPESRPKGQVPGRTTIVGVVRNSEKRPRFVAENQPDKDWYFYRDVDAMAKSRGTAPVYIELDQASSVPGGPIGGQTRVKLFNEHLQYIITWWSLSAITTFMWWYRYIKIV